MKPTRLYIKQCPHCGLKYFGKSIKVSIESYEGSGIYWKRHLDFHNVKPVHLWNSDWFTDFSITKFANLFSSMNRIVESADWANQVAENGLDGGDTSQFVDYETRSNPWLNDSIKQQEELEKRKSFDYKLKHSGKPAIHTPYGVFPSLNEVARNVDIGCKTSLSKWLKGKVVTRQMVNASKTNHFTLSDVGKNTNELGWYYVPI